MTEEGVPLITWPSKGLNGHDFAHAILYGRGGEDDENPRELVSKLVDEITALRADYWRLMPEDEPTTYLGYKQPGAAPKNYMPDDVVVDGDWLEREMRELEEFRAQARGSSGASD